MCQFGKAKSSDGTEQGFGSEAGQTQRDGAGYAVPSFGPPSPRAVWRTHRRFSGRCWNTLGQEHRGEMEGLKVLGLLVLAKQRPGLVSACTAVTEMTAKFRVGSVITQNKE